MMNFYYRLIKTFKCASMMIEKKGNNAWRYSPEKLGRLRF